MISTYDGNISKMQKKLFLHNANHHSNWHNSSHQATHTLNLHFYHHQFLQLIHLQHILSILGLFIRSPPHRPLLRHFLHHLNVFQCIQLIKIAIMNDLLMFMQPQSYHYPSRCFLESAVGDWQIMRRQQVREGRKRHIYVQYAYTYTQYTLIMFNQPVTNKRLPSITRESVGPFNREKLLFVALFTYFHSSWFRGLSSKILPIDTHSRRHLHLGSPLMVSCRMPKSLVLKKMGTLIQV